MSVVERLSVEQLAQQCAEAVEAAHFEQPSCYELMRRAFAEYNVDALTHVYQCYEQQVRTWVKGHNHFARTGESAEYFVRKTFSLCYFALRGPRFAHFPSVGHVLAYLKLSVHSVITQYLRDQRLWRVSPPSTEALEFSDLSREIQLAEMWTNLCTLLPDERDRLLARYVFVLDLKPRQIIELYPGLWNDLRELSIALYRIRQVLRSDETFRQWLLTDDATV